jgi:hypothetical protein
LGGVFCPPSFGAVGRLLYYKQGTKTNYCQLPDILRNEIEEAQKQNFPKSPQTPFLLSPVKYSTGLKLEKFLAHEKKLLENC